jgi:hypothetical protein
MLFLLWIAIGHKSLINIELNLKGGVILNKVHLVLESTSKLSQMRLLLPNRQVHIPFLGINPTLILVFLL